MNSWQQPAPSIGNTGLVGYGWGEFHFLKEKTAYDLSGRSNLYGSPYSWNLSSVIPEGCRGVSIWGYNLSGVSTGEMDDSALRMWDYDMGGYHNTKIHTIGLSLWFGFKDYGSNSRMIYCQESHCRIGVSRRIYCGQARSGSGLLYYAILRGYYL
jgi:hypothetical protein